MDENKKYYKSSSFDKLIPGEVFALERRIRLNSENTDISGLIPLPPKILEERRAESARFEQVIFEQIAGSVSRWEEQAAITMLLDKAIEYSKAPAVKHSSNQWVQDQYGYQERSNAVYKMIWRVNEHTRYDHDQKKLVPHAWGLTWNVFLNVPPANRDYSNPHIAGQKDKRFTDKAEMEKYLNGRINAFSSLFEEISPPIPRDLVNFFQVNGELLPNYFVSDDDAGVKINNAKAEPQNTRTSVLEHIEAGKAAKREKAAGQGNGSRDNISSSRKKKDAELS